LFISLLFLSLVLTLKDLVLALGLNTVPLNDVVIIVGALKGGLHFCELVLHSVKLNTGLFATLADFANLFFLLTE
jgi:hypothetical protein